jgi:SAM-dependent methyltransferase
MVTRSSESSTQTLDSYLADFGLEEEDLWEKKVLDAGAGSRLPAFDAATFGVGNIYSLDIETRWWCQWSRKLKGKNLNEDGDARAWAMVNEKSSGGSVMALPFLAESFDIILCRSVVPQYQRDAVEVSRALEEIVRVLKTGGEALFYPGWMAHWGDEEKKSIEKVVDYLAESGQVEAEWSPIVFRETGREGRRLRLRKLRGW